MTTNRTAPQLQYNSSSSSSSSRNICTRRSKSNSH